MCKILDLSRVVHVVTIFFFYKIQVANHQKLTVT